MAQDAPEHTDESLREVRSLDLTALRPIIQRVCRLAGALSGAQHAYVVLNEGDQIWHSAFAHFDDSLVDGGDSVSLRHEGGIWVEDALVVDPDHPWTAGAPFARFYCATPLRLSSGLRIGSLCVLGPEPKAPDRVIEAHLSDCAALLSEAVERLRAERARQAADRETRAAVALKETIMRSAPVALAMVDRDMRYVYVNARWSIDTGVSRERAIGAHVGDLFPESYAQLKDTYERCLTGESVWSDRVKIPNPRGHDRWLRAEVGPWRDADGKVAGLIAMSHDISDVIDCLDRAERSEQRLKLALEIAEVLVYEADYDRKELKIDGAADTFSGGDITFDMVVADPWLLVHPDDRVEALKTWKRLYAEGLPFRSEHRVATRDGREVWAFSGAEMTFRPDGSPERLLGVLKNITDRKLSEEQVSRARDAAEAASRAKSEFLANMSHEIRTPLNGVMGVAAALARTALTADQEEMVGLIRTSGQTLEAILSDLLDLARIESGKLELKAEPFALDASLRATADLFRPLAAEKGLDFDLDIDPSAEGWFEGDAVRLRQVVGNLLSNAVKFTTRGSVSLRAAVARGVLTLAVRDTGIGFDAGFKARMFERFEQADGSITRRFGGTGLGLAISSQLARTLGGDLTAEAMPGQGATFILTLPLAPASKPARLAEASAPMAQDRAPRVLLAEDHAVNRRVVQMLLEPAGVELICVENGAEAVEAALSQSFDLVLMDMQMPVMDGLTAIRAIRAGQAHRTPIWALSANALPEHIRASADAGADGHLTKPISPEALFEALSLACGAAEEAVAA
ncbi:MAG: response regulator [Caulobacteraceae bacterium]|nr:MAG: response regulator [Caulobacteraceae bacterium]